MVFHSSATKLNYTQENTLEYYLIKLTWLVLSETPQYVMVSSPSSILSNKSSLI